MAEQLQKDPEDWVSGAVPMTDTQASYLRTLSEQAGRSDPTRAEMTKAEAFELIDEMRRAAGLD
ncbi:MULTISPECIES: DUF3072 domain-containing protein [unclassified Bradyrhizobium]|uniref:DUF3072 domain-containing protein n=1 Tax=unclassified Bradyrhizobium TaxID=2631580 RepID=UPI002916EDE1|nr:MULTISPECIES: DUF3072 domain-containing protein [unclassified Bradyrhizobium]